MGVDTSTIPSSGTTSPLMVEESLLVRTTDLNTLNMHCGGHMDFKKKLLGKLKYLDRPAIYCTVTFIIIMYNSMLYTCNVIYIHDILHYIAAYIQWNSSLLQTML